MVRSALRAAEQSTSTAKIKKGRQMKAYRRHNCQARHRTYNKTAQCIWPRAHWVTGEGPYASVSRCRGTTVMLHKTAQDAEEAKTWIDDSACGGACRRAHEVIRLDYPHLVPTKEPEPPCGTPGAQLDGRMSLTLTKRGWVRKPNQFAGACAICGTHVPVGKGCTQWSDGLNQMQVYC